MRFKRLFVLLTVCISGAAMASSTVVPPAVNMTPTVYDDGKSCPNNCDAHVVFHPRHNGTANAYDPSSSRAAPARCVVGRPCRICFSASEASCMLATYRGAGPPPGRFDFTPAFYEENCPKADLPEAFTKQCLSARPAVQVLSQKINCVMTPEDPKCTTVIGAASRRKAADDTLYSECQTLGEAAFNRRHQGEPRLQRSNGCSYERFGTGRNSRGVTWRRLLDGACRPGTYAGRDGLDCCSGSLYAAALLGRECRQFFIDK